MTHVRQETIQQSVAGFQTLSELDAFVAVLTDKTLHVKRATHEDWVAIRDRRKELQRRRS